MLHFRIRDDPFLLRIDEQHLARFQAALGKHLLGIQADSPHFRSQDHPSVFGDAVPGRAQAVPVQHAAGSNPVFPGS